MSETCRHLRCISQQHFYLWALAARSGVKVGWYTQQPFHTPARIQEGWLDSTREHYTDEDEWKAEKVASAVPLLTGLERQIIREFYGAYVGAVDDRATRMRAVGQSKQNASRIRIDAERWVDGYVAACLEKANA